jgi:broad-specificity NMP kinase
MGKQSSGCIFFVIGASGSGKTAICNFLQKYSISVPGVDFEIHDIDEGGVPEFGRGYWKRYRTDELLGNARRIVKKKSSVLCGVITPHEVIDSDLFRRNVKMCFILLDASSHAISMRIRARATKRDGEARLKKLVESNIKFARKLKDQVLMQRNGFIVDTRNKSIKQVAGEVSAIIRRQSRVH